MPKNTWTEKEIEILRANYLTKSHKEIARLLFGRTEMAVKGKCKKLGFVKSKFKWTSGNIEIVKRLYPTTKTEIIAEKVGCNLSIVYKKARFLGLKKTEEFFKSDECGRLTKESVIGFNTRFKTGKTSWNKGKKLRSVGRMAETQFSKGDLPQNTAKVGDESIVNGYIKVKIADPNIWKWKHRLVWEQKNGAIPKQNCVIFRDGNSLNCVIENLELISRKELARRNSIMNLPPEIQDAYRLIGRLKRKINKKEKICQKTRSEI